MTFGAALGGPKAPSRPRRLPRKFFTSRKWTYDQTAHARPQRQPLAQLSGAGGASTARRPPAAVASG
jgi:hypothetical protein